MSENSPSINETSFIPEIERNHESEELNFEDIVFISKNNLGLRHVGKRVVAEENVRDGFYGDALALCGIDNCLNNIFAEITENNEKAKKTMGYFKMVGLSPQLGYLADFFNDSQKTESINLMHNKIVSFIDSSFGFSLLLEKDKSSVEDLEGMLQDRASFLIVKNSSHSSDDREAYLGLGKFGKRHFQSNDVLGVIHGSSVIERLKQEKIDPKKIVDDQFFDNKVVATYYNLIISSIKSARNADQVIV